MSDTQLILSGDENNVAMPMTDAEVNHLRRLLAWIRLEHSLGEEMMRGFLEGAEMSVRADPSCHAKAQQVVDERVAKVASRRRQPQDRVFPVLRLFEDAVKNAPQPQWHNHLRRLKLSRPAIDSAVAIPNRWPAISSARPICLFVLDEHV